MTRVVRSWPQASGVHALSYVPSRGAKHRRGARQQLPLWQQLPVWLDASGRPRHSRRTRNRFLDDVLWGQFCLFLFIRMQDDVLDGQASSPRLLFLADELLIESEVAFHRHIHNESFWRFFRSSLQATIRGILEAEAQQRRRGVFTDSWDVYARVASIFKIGSAAVCIRHGLHREFRRVSRCMDHLAIADQLIDDLCDLDEDLTAGRINAAARWLAGPVGGRRDIGTRIEAALHSTDRLDQLFDHVGYHLRRAGTILRPLQLLHANAHVSNLEQRLVQFANRLHARRVNQLVTFVKRESRA